jgi:hypothetical protein
VIHAVILDGPSATGKEVDLQPGDLVKVTFVDHAVIYGEKVHQEQVVKQWAREFGE